ncbi:hypothetical protein ACIRJO_02710 [Streptomyces sp. NPDC102394]|uniref:hypothetical protein n=1 Tax=Streptomyces sp. NPDC102394 TaxID=3366167 RepID=UPI00381F5CF5
MVTLTTHQLILVAFFGGLFAAMSVLGLVLAWKAALWLTDRLLHGHESLRDRRKHLQICRAIDALGTIDHPTE